jgi:hypothetical protein
MVRPTPPPTLDPVALVRQLDIAAIRNRLDDLTRERAALLVLLRAAQRAQREEEVAVAAKETRK